MKTFQEIVDAYLKEADLTFNPVDNPLIRKTIDKLDGLVGRFVGISQQHFNLLAGWCMLIGYGITRDESGLQYANLHGNFYTALKIPNTTFIIGEIYKEGL